jgi:hypothetical protein
MALAIGTEIFPTSIVSGRSVTESNTESTLCSDYSIDVDMKWLSGLPLCVSLYTF